MSDELDQLKGAARREFNDAVSRVETSVPESRGSAMVRQPRFSIEEGPTPPGFTGRLVNRREFNRRWEDEKRAARVRTETCTAQESTVESGFDNILERKGRLRAEFNKQSQRRPGRGR